MRTGSLGAAGLAGLLALVASACAASPATQVAEYSFPQDDQPVVTMTVRGTQLPIVTTLRIFASGTAIFDSSMRSGSIELPLSSEDREAVLREIADGGLADYDAGAVALEQKRLSNSRIVGNSPDSDLPGFNLDFRIERTRGQGAEPESISKSILIYGPGRLAQRFPSIRAYQSLARLEDLFDRLQTVAQTAR